MNLIDYSHTTIEWAEPRFWAHERDARDYRDGRDIEPVDNLVTQAIGREFARSEEMIALTINLKQTVVDDVELTIEV